MPWVSTQAGTTRAATPTPNGSPVCRIPIATPRRCAGNHPTTRRPLAEFELAAATPQSAKPRPRASVDPARAPITVTAAPATRTVSPVRRLMRSPSLSTRAPQATSVASVPMVGAAASVAPATRGQPSARWRWGMSSRGVLTTAVAVTWATMAARSICHGFARPAVLSGIGDAAGSHRAQVSERLPEQEAPTALELVQDRRGERVLGRQPGELERVLSRIALAGDGDDVGEGDGMLARVVQGRHARQWEVLGDRERSDVRRQLGKGRGAEVLLQVAHQCGADRLSVQDSSGHERPRQGPGRGRAAEQETDPFELAQAVEPRRDRLDVEDRHARARLLELELRQPAGIGV